MLKILLIASTLLFGNFLIAQEPDFRNVRWGMSRAEVKAAESAEFVKESESGFIYNDIILEYPIRIYYRFEHQGLFHTHCHLDEIESSQCYITFREELEALLTRKYGQPVEDTTHWYDSTHFKEPGKYWQALLLGHVDFYTQWRTETTKIGLMLGRYEEEDMLTFYISYEPLHPELLNL